MPERGATRLVALHGVESVGKSTLAEALAAHLGCERVPEYGRAYCEQHGTDLLPADLEAIAMEQQAQIVAARPKAGSVLITDTDWLMTAAWSEMLFGEPLSGSTYPLADLYLHLPPDLAFVQDAVRIFSEDEERERFDAICRGVLERVGANVVMLDAPLDQRLDQALMAISKL